MEGPRVMSRILLPAVLISAVLALPSAGISCEKTNSAATPLMRVAGEGKQSENRPTKENKDKCKRTSGAHATPPKGCPDGGERVPQDNKRSPLDDAPPLAPLVA
jgi:hypothetical protein